MNNVARMIMQYKMQQQDGEDYGDERDRDYRQGYDRGYRDGYDRANYETKGNYDGAESDGARRRSKTTGRYISDRDSLRLSKQDIARWEKNLQHGKHFDMHHVEEAANRLGIKFDEYSEKEFCMAMNMLYSDFCEVCQAYVSPEKEAMHYAKMARAFLEDKDGPSPSEKLALYFHCIADN